MVYGKRIAYITEKIPGSLSNGKWQSKVATSGNKAKNYKRFSLEKCPKSGVERNTRGSNLLYLIVVCVCVCIY